MNNLKVKPLALAIALGLSPSALVYAQSDSSADAQLEEVIVTGVKAADLNAREAERSKDAFSSIISQDDAGNFADQNVAESLQRLPGITLQKSEGEGRYVNVRGLGADFVSVTMNGSELASGGGDGRAFALDAIPADMLGSIEVYKSLTPDMDLNAIGGAVNVKTVSAFDKKRDTLKFKAQVNNQQYKDQLSPKISVSGTKLLFDDKIGIGFSASSEQRNSVNDEVRHHSASLPRYIEVNDVDGLIPYQFESRQEEGERTRNAGSLDIGFRPNDDSEYYVRLAHTSYSDLDIALREYYRLDAALDPSETVFLDTENRLVGAVDTELQHQFFIQDGEATTSAFSIGGENRFGDGWTVDYEYAKSIGEWDKPGARRAQFRLQDLPMIAAWGSNYHVAQVVSSTELEAIAGLTTPLRPSYGYNLDGDRRVQSSMAFDNLFIEDSFRTDDLNQIKINFRKDFESGKINYLKFGAQSKERDRDRNKDRWSVVPYLKKDIGCAAASDEALCLELSNASLGDFETFAPAHPDIKHNFITYDAANYLLNNVSTIATEFNASNDQDTVADDYVLKESVQNAYLMAEFQTSDKSTLIVGGKYETTEYRSTGNFSVRWDVTEGGNADSSNDIVLPLEVEPTKYSDFLPSIHWKYEATDDVLVRAALWTSFSRPNFSDSRARVEFDGRVKLCPTTGGGICSDRLNQINPDWNADTDPEIIRNGSFVGDVNTVDVGNPALRAQTAVNFDTSVTWYASDDLYFQGAFFYKDIKDFIVEVRGQQMALEDLSFHVPIEDVTTLTFVPGMVYDDVNMTVNGDSAKVYGLELTYSQYFNSGMFVQSNLTLMDSSATLDDSIRVDDVALPFQADETLNLTVGWENDDFSARLIANYRSAVLEQIGACGAGDLAADAENALNGDLVPRNCAKWADIYEDNTFGLDFKASWKINKTVDVYFDALNLTADKSVRYFSGNEYSGGKMMYSGEDFGSSFQAGVNVKIW